MLTYIFTPLVHAPWGEMQLTLITRATNYFDAERQAIAELEEWKRSQEALGKNYFPWIDEAIATLRDTQSGNVLGMHADKPDKTLVFWYDEREPYDK